MAGYGATRRLALLLLTAGVFAIAGAAAASAHAMTVAAPVLAWSDQPHLQAGETAAASSYQVFSDVGGVLKQLLSASLDHSNDSDDDAVVLLVLGSQLTTSDLHSRALRAPLASLQALLTGASSSVSLPFVLHTVAPASEQQRRVVQLASAHGATTTVVGCDGSQGGQQALADALQGLGSGPAVVVLCTASTSAEAAAGTPEAVQAELQQVQDAHAAVAALGRRQTTVYAVTPDADALPPLQRRQLQGVAGDAGACGQLCQTQVKWLEGLLAAFILVIAAISGMSCLYALDTPTRFQKPKEGSRAE